MHDVRKHLLWLLRGGDAHIGFEKAVAGLPAQAQGLSVTGIPHTAWRLIEHIRIAQWDILEFSRNPDHVSPNFPEGYWPSSDAPPNASAWDASIAAMQSDLREMETLVADENRDLFEPFAWGDGQTLMREALLVADHNAYHTGQLIALRQALGEWSA